MQQALGLISPARVKVEENYQKGNQNIISSEARGICKVSTPHEASQKSEGNTGHWFNRPRRTKYQQNKQHKCDQKIQQG